MTALAVQARRFVSALALGLAGLGHALLPAAQQPLPREERLGLFEASITIGQGNRLAFATFDSSRNQYTMTGSGTGIGGAADAFQFAYARTSGDLVIQTNARWTDRATNAGRQAGVMIRQSLEPGAPYAAMTMVGDGQIRFRFRRTAGGQTEDLKATARSPAGMRLERNGAKATSAAADVITASVQRPGGGWQIVGALSIPMGEEVYGGLALGAGSPAGVASAVFSDVALDANVVRGPRVRETTLEVLDVASGERRTLFRERNIFEAPNWSIDGARLLVNRRFPPVTAPAALPAPGAQAGRAGRGGGGPTLLFTIPVAGGEPTEVPTGTINRINNDHGYSFDGKWLAISASAGGNSKIFVLPATGGEPRQITQDGPSYMHGWSPDGKEIVFCGQRPVDTQGDVYSIAVDGSAPEKRLTTAEGLDDGPEFSPDGRYIYFNSVRSGMMKIWRMKADGSEQTQVTDSDPNYNDWFAHVSPDGRHIVFISFDSSVPPGQHPADQNVVIRMLPVSAAAGTKPTVIATLYGGQGTINTPSWSPDSKSIAFVSYRYVAP